MALIPSRAWGFIRVGLFGHYGVRADSLPTGGDFPALGAGTFESPGDDAVELVAVPATLPAQGDLVVYSNNAYTHGPIASPPDAWTCSLFYFRAGESGAQEAADSPFTVTDGEADGLTVIATPAVANASGATASVSLGLNVAATPATAAASGAAATIEFGDPPLEIIATPGTAAASGQPALVSVTLLVAATSGTATASGVTANIGDAPVEQRRSGGRGRRLLNRYDEMAPMPDTFPQDVAAQMIALLEVGVFHG